MPPFMADSADPGEGRLKQKQSQDWNEPVRDASDPLAQAASTDLEDSDVSVGIHLGEPGNALAH